jgi:hypothetical protein
MTPAGGMASAKRVAEETFEMSSDEAAVAAVDGGAGRTGALPFDVTVAHQARVYNYLLGGKDNISQVVRGTPHTAPTGAVQARYGDYSKTASLTV